MKIISNKINFIIMCAVALFMGWVLGTSLAYFTAEDNVDGSFSMGMISLNLTDLSGNIILNLNQEDADPSGPIFSGGYIVAADTNNVKVNVRIAIGISNEAVPFFNTNALPNTGWYYSNAVVTSTVTYFYYYYGIDSELTSVDLDIIDGLLIYQTGLSFNSVGVNDLGESVSNEILDEIFFTIKIGAVQAEYKDDSSQATFDSILAQIS